jgi:hypothetical protein
MCYEFSAWFTRVRDEKARRQQPRPEAATPPLQPASEPEPAGPKPRVEAREPAPA